MPGGSFREKVLSAVTTGTSTAYDALTYNFISLYVEFGAGTSAGVVTLEAAATPAYAGTWAVIGTATWTAVSTAIRVESVGRVFGAVRARITTDVVGGTADVYLLMN